MDDKLDRQKMSIEEMQSEIDTFEKDDCRAPEEDVSGRQSLSTLTDSMLSDKNRLRSVLLEKIVSLKSCMNRNPSILSR